MLQDRNNFKIHFKLKARVNCTDLQGLSCATIFKIVTHKSQAEYNKMLGCSVRQNLPT